MVVCKPIKLEYAAIHYVDIIEVPMPVGGVLELTDYFTLGVAVPKNPFGDQVSYLVRTALQSDDGTGVLDIQLQLDSFAPEQKMLPVSDGLA